MEPSEKRKYIIQSLQDGKPHRPKWIYEHVWVQAGEQHTGIFDALKDLVRIGVVNESLDNLNRALYQLATRPGAGKE